MEQQAEVIELESDNAMAEEDVDFVIDMLVRWTMRGILGERDDE